MKTAEEWAEIHTGNFAHTSKFEELVDEAREVQIDAFKGAAEILRRRGDNFFASLLEAKAKEL